jgi:hypothetical protein
MLDVRFVNIRGDTYKLDKLFHFSWQFAVGLDVNSEIFMCNLDARTRIENSKKRYAFPRLKPWCHRTR